MKAVLAAVPRGARCGDEPQAAGQSRARHVTDREGNAVDFESAPRRGLPRTPRRLHGRARLPERGALLPQPAGQPLGGAAAHRARCGIRRARRACGTCSCPTRSTVRASPTSSTRRCAEMMGRVLCRARGVQLRRARHRQHGDARALRHPAQKREWLEPLLAGTIRSAVRHDRAARRLQRRHQHRKLDRARRRLRTSSTGASGGPRAPAARAAGCSSSWARPIPPRPATASSR